MSNTLLSEQGLNMLFRDLTRAGVRVNITEVSESKYVNERSPACVKLIDNTPLIEILESLAANQKIEAKAHELAHMLVKSRGLAALDVDKAYSNNEANGFLALEINNAVSHPFVIGILRSDYSIGSQLHLQIRAQAIKEAPSDIEDLQEFVPCLHAIGMKLFDIEQTMPHLQSEAALLSASDTEVAAGLEAAKKWLSDITLDMDNTIQSQRIYSMLSDLGYNVKEFPLCS